MDSDKKVNWGRVLILAGAVIAFTIGSGFATGQEIIQYYTAYGVQGIFTVLLFAVCFIYYNYNFAKAGAEEHFEKGNDVYKFYCGKYVGTFMDYYSTIFCYMSFFVMVGGAASTLNQQYGLPSWVGGVVLTALAILTVVGGLNSLVEDVYKRQVRMHPELEVVYAGVNGDYLDSKDDTLCDWLTNGYKFNVIRVKDVLELEEPCVKISIYKKEGIEAATRDIYDEFKDQAKMACAGDMWMDCMACLLYTSRCV